MTELEPLPDLNGGALQHLRERGNNMMITETWLRDVGFKWHQFDRQPDKHWLLWLGNAIHDNTTGNDDIGIEVAPVGHHKPSEWFCWLRSDLSHKYSRFLHIRHISTCIEVIELVEALTGEPWNPQNNLFGSMHTQESADRLRDDMNRIDWIIAKDNPWREIEKDETRGGPLPEHLEHHAKCLEES